MSKEITDSPVETQTQIVITVPPFLVKSTNFVKRHASKAGWFIVGATAGATTLYLTAVSSDSDELEDSDENETDVVESSVSTPEIES